MSVLKQRVLWYKAGQTVYTELHDAVRVTVRKGLDAKGNTVEVILTNAAYEYNGTDTIHRYIEPQSNYITINLMIYLRYL